MCARTLHMHGLHLLQMTIVQLIDPGIAQLQLGWLGCACGLVELSGARLSGRLMSEFRVHQVQPTSGPTSMAAPSRTAAAWVLRYDAHAVVHQTLPSVLA